MPESLAPPAETPPYGAADKDWLQDNLRRADTANVFVDFRKKVKQSRDTDLGKAGGALSKLSTLD